MLTATIARFQSALFFGRMILAGALMAAVLIVALAAPAATASAAPAAPTCSNTITVMNGNDSGAGSLRQAIADVCPGGTISFNGDMTVTLEDELIIDHSLTIEGQERRVTISGNNVTRVFYVEVGEVHLNRLTITNGWAGYEDGGGVKIDVRGWLILDSCLLINNATHYNGGAIYNNYLLTVRNSTLTGNRAGATGGAIYSPSDTGPLVLNSNTITRNSGSPVGGVSNAGATHAAEVNNTIIASQMSGRNCELVYSNSSGNNLSDTSSCDHQSDAVLLGSLGEYGGVTQSVPLLPGSAAIDAGASCADTFDQRGFPRVGRCDIGAFESQGFNVTVAGGNNQTTVLNTAFSAPLSVSVAPNQPGEPVNGGQITFAAPASGALAALTGSPATISGGSAGGVTATANDQCGTYNVTASARGASTATFNLTNTGVTSYVVTSGADSGAGSLRAGIAASCAGGMINFDGNRAIALTSRLDINKSLTIDGSGRRVTVDGGGVTALLSTTGADVRLTHLTFANGRGDSGVSSPAGIYAESGNLTITGCAFINNVTPEGLYSSILFVSNTASTVTIINSSFSGNRSYSATILSMSALALKNCSFFDNSAHDGVISNLVTHGSATINNVLLAGDGATPNCNSQLYVVAGSGNNLSSDGTCGSSFTQASNLLLGAPNYYDGDTPTIPLLPGSPAIDAGANCFVTDQRGHYRKGACDVGSYEADFIMSKSGGDNQGTVINTAFANPLVVTVTPAFPGDPVDGGVVSFTAPASGASATLSAGQVTISGGKASVTATANGTVGSYTVTAASRGPGSVAFNLTNQLCSQTVTSSADSGGGSLREAIANVCAGGTITFDGDRTITLASQLSIGKSLTIDATGHKVTVSGNNAVRVLNITGGSVTLRGLTIVNGMSDTGGGINTAAATTVERCTFTGNWSREGGGAIYVASGSLGVTNSTFSGNTSFGAGGALYNSGGTVTLTNVTISGSSSGAIGGAVYTAPTPSSATTKAISSIVAGSTAGGNCKGKNFHASSKNNIADDVSCSPGFTPVVSAGLDPLGDYGGDTQTMRLKSDSPAIDAGASCPAIDQRGQARDDLACDIGAFELKLSDSHTVTKSVSAGKTFTFGPTYAQITVNSTAGCLTGITIMRHDENHASATDPLKTGHWWGITAAPSGCSGFGVDVTLPTDFTPDATGQDKLCFYTGTDRIWDCAWSASGTNSLTRAGVTHFSDWAVGRGAGPNAVRLSGLYGEAAAPGWIWVVAAFTGALAGLALGRIARARRA